MFGGHCSKTTSSIYSDNSSELFEMSMWAASSMSSTTIPLFTIQVFENLGYFS